MIDDLEAAFKEITKLEGQVQNLEGRLKKKFDQLNVKDVEIESLKGVIRVYKGACAALLAGHALGGEKFDEALESVRRVVNES